MRKSLLKWADYYCQQKVWIYPYNLKESPIVFWKNIKNNEDYQSLYKSWNWNTFTGIKLVIGKKGSRVIEVKTKVLLKKALNLLGLPKDYDWIIYGPTKYGIVVDTPGVSIESKGMSNRSLKKVLILWDGYYMLPTPGVSVYFYQNRIPQCHPMQVKDEVFFKCIKYLTQ